MERMREFCERPRSDHVSPGRRSCRWRRGWDWRSPTGFAAPQAPGPPCDQYRRCALTTPGGGAERVRDGSGWAPTALAGRAQLVPPVVGDDCSPSPAHLAAAARARSARGTVLDARLPDRPIEVDGVLVALADPVLLQIVRSLRDL